VDTLSLYAWDFQRLPSDKNSAFLTCSVPVFQWVPKASGRGLKKVNVCRVCGYMLDPQAVYRKAQEICDRLTAENARFDRRPKWLQKQYAVPKPKGLVVPRLDRDLPGSVVRSIRLKVMQRILVPAGFVKGKEGTYVRRQRDQIHLIDFQAARFGHEFTVNLGFHYAFLTPLLAGKRIPLADYIQVDCGLRARIGDFAKGKQDQWFEYGTDRGKLQSVFEHCAQESFRVFTVAERRFVDPASLLVGAACAMNERFIRPWRVLDAEFAAYLALHLGKYQAARRAFERLYFESEGPLKRRYERLLSKLGSHKQQPK
jgi:hypothetical protein